MSISFTPGNYRTREELQKQLDFYYKQLSLASTNLAKSKDIDNGAITRAELRLAPQFTQKNSLDRLKDASYQRQLAYTTLSEVFSQQDTDAILSELMAKDEVILFNTYSKKFFEDYGVNANMSIPLFFSNWKLFQQKLDNADISSLGTTLTDIKTILESGNKTQAEIIDEIKKSSLSTKEKADAIETLMKMSNSNLGKIYDQLAISYDLSNLPANIQNEIKRIDSLDEKTLDNELDYYFTGNPHYPAIRNGNLVQIGKARATPNQKKMALLLAVYPNLRTDIDFSKFRESNLTFRDRMTQDSRNIMNELNNIQDEQKNQTGELISVNRNLQEVRGRIHNLGNVLRDIGLSVNDTKELVSEFAQITDETLENIRNQLLNSRLSQTQTNQILMEIIQTLEDSNTSNETRLEEIRNILRNSGTTAIEQRSILQNILSAQNEQAKVLTNALKRAGFEANEIKQILVELLANSNQPFIDEERNPEKDYLELVSLDLPQLKAEYDKHFLNVLNVPVLVSTISDTPPYNESVKVELIDKDSLTRKDDMAKAIVLSIYPELRSYDFAFDSENLGSQSSRKPSEILHQAIQEIIAGDFDAGRRSFGEINPSRLNADARRAYNQIKATLEGREQIGDIRFRGDEKQEIEKQTRDARNLITDLFNATNNKNIITRYFNADFKQYNDDEDVPSWDPLQRRTVAIRKGDAKTKYWRKVEAVVLYRYPLADLTNITIPYRMEGEGIKAKKVPRHKPVGEYLIHIPSLQKGYLYIQYPSQWRIKHFPKKSISSLFQDLVWDLVDERKFDLAKYKKLKSEEQKLYDELIATIKIPKNEIKGLGTHKSLVDKDRDACLKKLKILTGEIHAGNNSKKIMKELKILLLKMIDKSYISRKDANKLIYDVMVIDE